MFSAMTTITDMIKTQLFEPGTIEVVAGLMGAGKTRFVNKRIEYFKEKEISYLVFDPLKNERSQTHITTRFEGKTIELSPCIKFPESDPWKIYEIIARNEIIPQAAIVDEAQFLHNQIVSLAKFLSEEGIYVLFSGLHLDYRKRPFGPMFDLLKIADKRPQLEPLKCATSNCLRSAEVMQARFENGQPVPYLPDELLHTINWIGDERRGPVWYEPVCDLHHELPERPDFLIS